MAEPTTNSFADIILEVETSTPGTYAARMCGITSKGLNLTASASTANVPDCDNPEDPGWEKAGVTAKAAEMPLSGIAAAEDEAFWNQWFDSGASKNIRYRKIGQGYRSGAAILTALGESVALGAEANLVQRSITLKNAGAFPWAAGDPS